MIRKSTTFIALLLLVSMFALPGYCGTTERVRILADLSKSPTRPVAAKLKTNRKDLGGLTLDLVVYRWTARTGKSAPVDVARIDEVVSVSSAELSDSLLTWAAGTFAISTSTPAAAQPPKDEPRVAQLSELKRQFLMALDYKESSPIQSAAALSAAVALCRDLQLDLSGAYVSRMLGNLYHKGMARYRQAEECYQAAEAVFPVYQRYESAALLYEDYGALCWEMARYLAATEKYSASALQWAQLEKLNPKVSRYYGMAGRQYINAGTSQNRTGDTSSALRLLNSGIRELRNEAVMTKNYSSLITNLLMVASVYRQQDDLPKALDRCRQAADACKYDDDPQLNFQVRQQLAADYRAMNLIRDADSEAKKAKQILVDAAAAGRSALATLASPGAIAPGSRPKLQLTAERGAGALQTLKDYAAAEALFRRVLDIYKQSGTVDQQIRCLRSLAAVLDLQQKSQDSLDARLQAAKLATQSSKKVLAAEIVSDLAQAFINIGDVNNALDALAELAPIVQQSGNIRRVAEVLDGRGTLLAAHARYDDAIRDFSEALQLYSSQIGDPWSAGRVSVKLASAMQAAKKPADAQSALEGALRAIEARYADENVDPSVDPERSRLMMSMYKELTSGYVLANNTDSAKALVAKARRFSWIQELIGQLRSSPDAAVAAFGSTVDAWTGEPDTTTPPDMPSKAALLADNWADFSTKCRSLHEQDPAHYNALPINPQEFYKSRNDLPRKALVIEYLVSDYATYAFVVSNGKSRIWELTISSNEISGIAERLRRQMKSCERQLSAGIPLPRITDWQEPNFMKVRDQLVALYAKLLQPISADLPQGSVVMFTLPDELAGIPMHALISSVQNNTPRFLIQDYEIGYLAQGMLSDLIGKDSRPIDSSSDRLAIFADPDGNLPGARQEARMLKELYYESGLPYVGRDANMANFLRECDRAAILHIAVHYKIDPDPSKFVLQLAPDNTSNGEITVQQLTQITNPHLQLVVLSACESAASTDPLKSGASSAAEVFSLAGAKSVLGGLWKVTDAPASKLMGDFYRTLVRANSRAESLRRAQTAMIDARDYAHPFYWACFALYGNPW